MSLATYAAPYNESDNINSNGAIDEKRRHRNKTLKRRDHKPANPKVDAMMKQIYNEDEEENSDSGAMSDFQPLGAPESASMINSDRGMNPDQREHYDYDANGYTYDNYFKTGNYFKWNDDYTETAEVTLHGVSTYHD